MNRAVLLLIALLVMSTSLSAQRKRSVLRISTTEGIPITVAINDRRYDKVGETITIADLPSGHHNIQVYEYKAYRDENGGRAKLLYSGSVRTRKQMLTTATINPANRRMRVRMFELDQYDAGNKERYDDNTQTGSLSQRDITELRTRVEEHITDTDRLKLLKSVLPNYTYQTEDIKAILPWLSFESSRLELAKWAYANVTDKSNFWKLESEFTFSSSKDELNEYIQANR